MLNVLTKYLPYSASVRIGLAPGGIALLKTSGVLRPATRLVSECSLTHDQFTHEQSATPQALADQLRRLLSDADCANHPATVVVADDWVRLFMVTPPHNTSSLQDCRAAAAMRFQELYGEPIDSWQLIAHWQVQHAFLACAMPAALITSLQQVAIEYRLTLLSIVPQLIAAWNFWRKKLKPGAWLGLIHDNTLTLAAIDQQRVCAVRATVVPEGAWQDREWLPGHLAREALRLNLPTPAQLQLCGPIPGQSAATALSPLWSRLEATQPGWDRGLQHAASPATLLARTGIAA